MKGLIVLVNLSLITISLFSLCSAATPSLGHWLPAKSAIPLRPQPATRPISHVQLVAEVKGIYTGLVISELYEERDCQQDLSDESSWCRWTDGQWRDTIAHHSSHLLENHDFLLASQYDVLRNKSQRPAVDSIRDMRPGLALSPQRGPKASRGALLMLITSFSHGSWALSTQHGNKVLDGSGEGHDSLVFNSFWYISLLLVVIGYAALSYVHRDRRSFLGLGMGLLTWAYLIMVLVGGVPLDVIIRYVQSPLLLKALMRFASVAGAYMP